MRPRITIPIEMIEAFKSGRGHQAFGDFTFEYRAGLESAVRWLEKELESKCLPNITPWQAGYNSALRDVLSIFELNSAVDKIKTALYGTTLTRTEADEILRCVNLCVPPEREK